MKVSDGKLEHYRIHPTRKEEDFLIFIQQLCSKASEDEKIVIIADQLNTHKSETLTKWVAKEINYKGELGKKEYKGILKSQQSRMEFLENPNHRIRFIFTPKHCSWLNPIENWFGKLQKQRLRNASFESIEDLEKKMVKYIEYTNQWCTKPYKWKFKGFLKSKPILHTNG